MKRSTNSIHGLPAKAYINREFWETECNTVLADGWTFVGFVHEFLNPGDVIPISIGGKPILLIKNAKNQIVAFHNVCSHRCLKLVDEKKNVGKIIQCPYHSWIYDLDGKSYLDFVAGVSANTLGHSHPKVVNAVQEQAASYMHVMVYGEYAQGPAVELAKLLAQQLPEPLSSTYLVNSGTEAIEGAMKLSKRATGRGEIIAAKHAYHGNTQGSMSLMGYEERKKAYRPLLPGIKFIEFSKLNHLQFILTLKIIFFVIFIL